MTQFALPETDLVSLDTNRGNLPRLILTWVSTEAVKTQIRLRNQVMRAVWLVLIGEVPYTPTPNREVN